MAVWEDKVDKKVESRAYTKEEVRDMFLKYAKMIASEWANIERDTVEEQIRGAIFSLLVAFDGESIEFPCLDIVLRPCPEDKEYCEKYGRRWFEDGMVINDDKTCLHDLFYKV